MIQCLECGKRNLKWNYEDFKRINIWRLWEGRPLKPHKCSLTFLKKSPELVERDFAQGMANKEIQTTNKTKGI